MEDLSIYICEKGLYSARVAFVLDCVGVRSYCGRKFSEKVSGVDFSYSGKVSEKAFAKWNVRLSNDRTIRLRWETRQRDPKLLRFEKKRLDMIISRDDPLFESDPLVSREVLIEAEKTLTQALNEVRSLLLDGE